MRKKRPNSQISCSQLLTTGEMPELGTTWVKTPGFDRIAKEGVFVRKRIHPNGKMRSIACDRPDRQTSLAAGGRRKPYGLFSSKVSKLAGNTDAKWLAHGHLRQRLGPGIALDKDGKERLITGNFYNGRKMTPPAQKMSNRDYAANFADFLDDNKDGKPWCFW